MTVLLFLLLLTSSTYLVCLKTLATCVGLFLPSHVVLSTRFRGSGAFKAVAPIIVRGELGTSEDNFQVWQKKPVANFPPPRAGKMGREI